VPVGQAYRRSEKDFRSGAGAGGDAKAVACPECHYLNGCHAKKCSKK
jgi:hypothetical protein